MKRRHTHQSHSQLSNHEFSSYPETQSFFLQFEFVINSRHYLCRGLMRGPSVHLIPPFHVSYTNKMEITTQLSRVNIYTTTPSNLPILTSRGGRWFIQGEGGCCKQNKEDLGSLTLLPEGLSPTNVSVERKRVKIGRLWKVM